MPRDLFAKQPKDLLAQQPSVNDDIGAFQAAAIAAGRGLTTVGRAVGLAEPEDPLVTKNFKELEKKRPISTTIGEIAGQAAPFLLPGAGVGAIASTPLRVGASTLLGAAEGAAISKGEGRGDNQTAISAGVGGLAAGTFELVLPRLSRVGSKIVKRVLGKNPSSPVVDAAGNISEEFAESLKREGRSLDEIVGTLADDLDDFVDPDQVTRKAFLESQGIKPTRAQITRSADDFQVQQEAFKSSTRARTAIEGQEAALTSRFNNAVKETGGSASTPTSTVTDALVEKATELDSNISRLYQQARDVAPGEKNIRFERLSQKLRQLSPSNRRTGGSINAIVGDLQSKGVLDADMKVVGRISVDTAEDVRKLMNELYDPANGFANNILRQLKDALDDDVFSAAGRDVFMAGRKAKHTFEKELSRAGVSKFDSRKANLVRDVLENKIDPDRLVETVIFGKKWRPDDLHQLKKYISSTPSGKQAFNDMRAETLHLIKEKAFTGPLDENGFKALSRDKLERAINQIGEQKIKLLFNDSERKFLNNILQVSKLREPVRGTALGRGPSAQAIGRLEQKLKQSPLFGSIVDIINIDSSGRAVIKASPKRKAISPPSSISQAAGATGVALTQDDR